MTLQAQSFNLPDPPSEGVPDFQLLIFSENATILERWFSALDEARAGLGVEVTARVDPSGASRTLVFTGRPDLVACEGNEIVQFRLNDGSGWKDIFYGTIVEGWAAQPMDDPKTYTADADELLNARVTDTKVYGPQDPTWIAMDLVWRLRHPALKYDASRFQLTGTTLEGGFDMPGVPLGQALEQLAKSAEDAGYSFAYGVDGSGHVFFRHPTGTANVLYRPEDVEGFEPLPINARGTTTAVYWVIGNEPSQPSYTRDYKPGTLAYLSVPDLELHNRYGRITGRTFDGNPFIPKASLSYAQYGFSDPTRAIDTIISGNRAEPNIATVATRTGVTGSDGAGVFFELTNSYDSVNQVHHIDGLPIYGVQIRYQNGFDTVSAGRSPFMWFFWRTLDANGNQGTATSVETLPFSNDGHTTLDYIFPPPQPYWDSAGAAQYPIATLRRAMVMPGDVGTFAISDLRWICLNTPLLAAAARRELFLPAFEPATITPTRDTADGLKTFYVEPKPQVQLFEYPGNPVAPAAEFRYSFNEDFHAGTVIDLGSPNRDDDGRLEQIRLGVDRKTRQSEVRSIGRVGR